MKKATLILLVVAVTLLVPGCTPKQEAPPAIEARETATEEILSITAHDGVTFDGKLRLPAGGAVDKVVIYVNGSGPMTYDTRRLGGESEFNYFDLFAEQFGAGGIAFFSYNTRGVTPGENPPLYSDIDIALYQTYKPSNEIQDMEAIITRLKSQPALRDAKVILLGWSAGAIIAPQVALAGHVQVDALFLAGYPAETMEAALLWQQDGHSSMTVFRQYYDYDKSGDITADEYNEDRYGVTSSLGSMAFSEVDMNADGVITAEDFGIMLADNREAVLKAFEDGDDDWIMANYGVPLTSGWYQDYKNYPPNRETLLKLDLPIHIFHGEYDANVSVEGVHETEADFKAAGKENLTVHIYDDHDHDLNFSHYPYLGVISEGMQGIFDAAAAL